MYPLFWLALYLCLNYGVSFRRPLLRTNNNQSCDKMIWGVQLACAEPSAGLPEIIGVEVLQYYILIVFFVFVCWFLLNILCFYKIIRFSPQKSQNDASGCNGNQKLLFFVPKCRWGLSIARCVTSVIKIMSRKKSLWFFNFSVPVVFCSCCFWPQKIVREIGVKDDENVVICVTFSVLIFRVICGRNVHKRVSKKREHTRYS